MKKHLCSFSNDHLISSDSFCLPEGDSSYACLCGVAPPRLPVTGACGDGLKFPEKDRHFLLLRGASSKGWRSTGSIRSVECVEGGREPTNHQSADEHFSGSLKTALGPLMNLGTPDYSLRNSPSAGSKTYICDIRGEMHSI